MHVYFLRKKSKRKVFKEMSQYIITDGERYVYQNHFGKYVPTNCEVMAEIFTKRQANMIYQNSLPKALKSIFYISKYDNPASDIKQVTKQELSNYTEKLVGADYMKKWIAKLSDLNGLATDALHRKNELIEELSNTDKELSDLNHYIEFTNLNAAQGYKASKMIKERRIKRRVLKNEMDIINMILSKKISETLNNEINNYISGLENRTYEPRVLKELFDI